MGFAQAGGGEPARRSKSKVWGEAGRARWFTSWTRMVAKRMGPYSMKIKPMV